VKERETFTWEQAWAYVDEVLEREWAEQGITVRITDPSQLALTAQLLRAGKGQLHATRVEMMRGADPL
jgi:hypothetical protein